MQTHLRKFLALLTALACFPMFVIADHIIGGELQMNKLGTTNTFEVRLVQFWDANNLIIPTPTSGGNRDETATLYIYQKSDNRLMELLRIDYKSSESIAYQNRACATSRSMRVSVGIYSGQIKLDPFNYSDPGGYYIVWERCCRNGDINNIVLPGDAGMVFYLEFPPVTSPNSSPAFVIPNGQYICANRPFSMSMKATDADGDELRYALVTPMRGYTTPEAPIGRVNSRIPFPTVNWASGISLNAVIPGPNPLRIDNSGMLTVTAGAIGLYVFAVEVTEYRNGKPIGKVRRDFQLLVIDCNDEQPERPVIMYNAAPVKEVSFCRGNTMELQTESSPDWAYQWQLNGLNIPGATAATITVSDTGNYSVIKSYTKQCSRDTASDAVRATFAAPVAANITADADLLCAGQTTILRVNGGTVQPGYQVAWKKDNQNLAGALPAVEIQQPGAYSVELTPVASGCKGSDTLTITSEAVEVTLPERTVTTLGKAVTLMPILNPDRSDYSYEWSPADGALSSTSEKSILVAPASETTYTVSVTTPGGCTAQASTLVHLLEQMYIPAAFSPNQDGHNDAFEIFNFEEHIVEMRIYNRWGELIFHSEGYETPWNGTYKDQPVPAGSYPYVIKTSGQDVSGTVMLLR